VALGVAAVIEPMAATFDVELFVGWLFLAAGIVGLCGIGLGRRIFGFWWEVMAALLAIAIGGYLVWRPLNGVIPLSIVAAVFFAAQGLTQIIVAMSHRAVLASWVWVLLSSIVNFGLAVIVFSGSPNIAAWTLGLAFGINLIMWGAALIAIAIASRAASSPK